MGIRSINELNLKGQRVLIRVDFNVPMDASGAISDDNRIRAALPTIRHAIEAGARVVLMSHMGRPKGEVVKGLSLVPVARRLSELLGTSVNMASDCIGDEVKNQVAGLKDGEVLLLENLRFHKGESKNEPDFAKALAELADVYINDAFATAHRAHASNVGVCDFVKLKAAGFLLSAEVEHMDKAPKHPVRPLAAIVGGAKVSGKLEVLENLLDKVDKLVIGGGMAYTFMKALGQTIGTSLCEDDLLETAKAILAKAKAKGVKLYLPVDGTVVKDVAADAPYVYKSVQEFAADDKGVDIGPATRLLYAEVLSDCGTIVWNGPMGIFEMEAFAQGTIDVAHAVAESKALTIVGGGDTDAAVHKAGVLDKIDFVSTAGGAFLEMLGGHELPGVKALED